jgi:hypothetical protein
MLRETLHVAGLNPFPALPRLLDTVAPGGVKKSLKKPKDLTQGRAESPIKQAKEMGSWSWSLRLGVFA